MLVENLLYRGRIGRVMLNLTCSNVSGISLNEFLFLLRTGPCFIKNYNHFACIFGINCALTACCGNFNDFAHEWVRLTGGAAIVTLANVVRRYLILFLALVLLKR